MTQKIKKDSLMLLLGKKKYVLLPIKFSCEFGFCDLTKLVGKPFGTKVKVGKEPFVVVKPTIIDLLKKAKRGPQVILPKDSGTIVSVTGCAPGWKVVEAGTGSGFLTMFLANLGCEVHSYERRKEFYMISTKNVKNFGFTNVTIRNADITKGIKEKEVDLVTLDMQNPEKAIRHAYKALLPGGWLSVYSMHIEQVKDVLKELAKYKFADIRIMEATQREWQSTGEMSRPKTYMMAHTGFLTFARKL